MPAAAKERLAVGPHAAKHRGLSAAPTEPSLQKLTAANGSYQASAWLKTVAAAVAQEPVHRIAASSERRPRNRPLTSHRQATCEEHGRSQHKHQPNSHDHLHIGMAE